MRCSGVNASERGQEPQHNGVRGDKRSRAFVVPRRLCNLLIRAAGEVLVRVVAGGGTPSEFRAYPTRQT